jgi:hypothetical protein
MTLSRKYQLAIYCIGVDMPFLCISNGWCGLRRMMEGRSFVRKQSNLGPTWVRERTYIIVGDAF